MNLQSSLMMEPVRPRPRRRGRGGARGGDYGGVARCCWTATVAGLVGYPAYQDVAAPWWGDGGLLRRQGGSLVSRRWWPTGPLSPVLIFGLLDPLWWWSGGSSGLPPIL